MGSLLFTERKRETLDRRLETTGRFNDCREDPTTAEKIDIDLVLVLVQHNDSRSGNEEEPSLRVKVRRLCKVLTLLLLSPSSFLLTMAEGVAGESKGRGCDPSEELRWQADSESVAGSW
ncbi:hypothetical protein BHE74_00021633 [Ensete ventricosum]|nr:hypothetical protein BHE74_00021633 [Ensete ventricosum]RZR95573.1 hypothetical protein BHM03_00024431 [Ensete ventricosum]